MPSMFPVSHNSDPGDRNRAINYWRPGDGIPGTVKTAFVLFLVAGIGLLVSGAMMWLVERPVVDDPEHMEYIRTVSTNMKWVGGVQIIAALAVAALLPGLLRGDGRRRRWVLVAAAVAMIFTLLGWVLDFGTWEQPLIALALALGCLAMYRPSVRTYYGGTPGELED